MSSWEDTVIGDEQLQEYTPAGVYGKELVAWESFQKELAKVQAQISFKAGIREVVEWLFNISTAQEVDFPPKIISFTMVYAIWQAQIKEWGIEE